MAELILSQDKDFDKIQIGEEFSTRKSHQTFMVFSEGCCVCKNDCPCMRKCGLTHQQTVYDYGDRCSAYPPKLCEQLALLLRIDMNSRFRRQRTALDTS